MFTYWYEVVYQSRANPLSVSRHLVKIDSLQDNYENALMDNAVKDFCIHKNNNNWCGEYMINSVNFIKKVSK